MLNKISTHNQNQEKIAANPWTHSEKSVLENLILMGYIKVKREPLTCRGYVNGLGGRLANGKEKLHMRQESVESYDFLCLEDTRHV